MSKNFKKVGPSTRWKNNTWLIGPSEDVDGAYYIYKHPQHSYEILKLYRKETANQHRKSDGTSDYTEKVYSNDSYEDIIRKGLELKNEKPLNEEAITTSAMPATYSKNILQKRR